MQISNSNRRSFIKLLAATPLLTQIAARDLYAQAATAVGKDPRRNVYKALGVNTVINCQGTWTYLSGSLEFPEVRQAQLEAAHYFVNMIMDNLEEADMKFDDVVSTVIYLDDLSDQHAFEEVYTQYFETILPATSIVQQIAPTKRKADNEDNFPGLEQVSLIAVRRNVTK